jgi:hypothetical protein
VFILQRAIQFFVCTYVFLPCHVDVRKFSAEEVGRKRLIFSRSQHSALLALEINSELLKIIFVVCITALYISHS